MIRLILRFGFPVAERQGYFGHSRCVRCFTYVYCAFAAIRLIRRFLSKCAVAICRPSG